MRMYDVVEVLSEMLDAAAEDKALARAQYGTVEYLLDWLKKAGDCRKSSFCISGPKIFGNS